MVEIPPELARGLRLGYVDDEWVGALPSVIAQARKEWGLDVGEPYTPGGACSWVAPAGRFVLKIGLRDYEAEHEIEGLTLWDGRGTARLYDSFVTGRTVVLLLERCEPGTPLRDALGAVEQDEVVADRLLTLWITPPDDHPFRPLSGMTGAWIETLERDLSEHRYDGDPALVDEARRIYRDEGDNVSEVRLLCTDLHGGNILAAEREPWLVIDPKPFVGDPAYDVVQHMLNHIPRLEDDPFAFADRMASLTGCDRDRVRMWLFARAMQESLGGEDYQRRLRPVAIRLAGG